MSRRRSVGPVVALAGSLVLVGQAELWLLPALDDELAQARAAVLPFAVVAPAALVLRTRAPLAAVLLGAGAVVTQALLVAPAMMLSQLAAVLVAVYSVAAHSPLPRAVAGLVVACTAPATLAVLTDATMPESLSIALFAGVPWLAGRAVRRQRAYAGRLEDLTTQLEREKARSAALAVAEERGLIARELHDILAHGLGVMTLQAGGARRMLRRDPDRAHAALCTIEDTGRQALAEVRRLLDEVDPRPAGAPPPPSLDEIGPWLRRAVGEAQPLTVRVEGEPRILPPGLDRTAFRIVQEAVTNAVKHAPGAVTSLLVRYGADAVELEVANGPGGPASTAPPGRGRGLIGMRERVAVFGGVLETGPTGDGGFAVRARLPLEPVR